MITRYTTEGMRPIWLEKNSFDIWLDVEIAACVAWNKHGVIPDNELQKIKKAKFSLDSYNKWFGETKHDLISFTRSVSESLGDEGRWIHHGLTSNDVKDTALSIQMSQAVDVIEKSLISMMSALKDKAIKYKMLPCVGRSHGVHAEPMSFGLKLALWWDETNRHLIRIQELKKIVKVGMISGPVGTHASIPPEIEETVCEELGLKPAPVSNQVIQRDRHADVMQRLALIASSLDKFATEIRSLQRTEIGEVQEPFGKPGFVSTGSSSMPHKRNPELSERISGLARVIRSNSLASLENIPLWHERDISHSSSERIIIPDSFLATDYIIEIFTSIISEMLVFPHKMKENLNKGGGIVFSEKVMLALVEKGILRKDAYELVQKAALTSMDEKKDFKILIKENELIKDKLSTSEIESLFDHDYYLRFIDKIFERLDF
jgi:adenylosuccinate lyase